MSRSRSRSIMPSAQGGRHCREQGRRRARGRVLPPLSSLGRRDSAAARRRPARPGDVDGGAAHHQHRPVHRRRRTGGRSRRRRRAAPSTAVGVHSLDHMIEFGGRVRDVLASPPHHSRPVRRHHDSDADGSRAAPPACCSARSRPPPSSASRSTAARGSPKSPRPTCRRFRFVPTSTVAPTGPVTAPPDEIVEHPTFDMLHAEMNAFGARHRGEARPIRCRSTRCCTAWRCSTPS